MAMKSASPENGGGMAGEWRGNARGNARGNEGKITMRLTRRATPILVVLIASTLAVGANAAPRNRTDQPKTVAEGTVRSIVDGDTLVLESGTQVRLVGIQAPKLPLGRRYFRTWPLAGEAKDALAALASGKRLTLRYGGQRIDRHGRLLAHLHTGDGIWVQGALLKQGMARVYSFPDNRSRVTEMLAIEQEARAAKRGIWNHSFYALLTPESATRHIDSFQLIEGTIVSVATVRGRGYLNFGEDWKTDFTISISPRYLRGHWRNSSPIASLQGKRVRVRGWLKSYRGPLIDATHPEQIEILP
jgi:endonuclease YncB( thermonuclease family)